jgi:hypothetical protein
MIGAGFAADDDPADPGQAEGGQRPEQRFTRQKPDRGRDGAQLVRAPAVAVILDRGPDPHVRQRPALAGELKSRSLFRRATAGRAAASHRASVCTLPRKSGRSSRRRSRAGCLVSSWKVCCGASAITANIRAANAAGTRAWPMSDIELTNTRRGVCERSGASSAPLCTVTPNPGAAGARISVHLVFGLAHGFQPRGQPQRVAVLAAGRDAVAAGHRVPGRPGRTVIAPRPLDLRRGAHRSPSGQESSCLARRRRPIVSPC